MKLIIGISGASGVELGLRFIEYIPKQKDLKLFIVCSENSKIVLAKESKNNATMYSNHDIAAPIASGSFLADAMIIVPCSTNTLSKISHGIADNLITRAASVMMKEKKNIILALRETPLSSVVLKNMYNLSKYGVSIAPPILGYYSKQQNLADMEKFLYGKWLDLLKIDNDLYPRWKG